MPDFFVYAADGRRFPLESRRVLGNSSFPVQDFYLKPRTLFCGCEPSRRLPLIVVSDGNGWYLRTWSASDHSPSCVITDRYSVLVRPLASGRLEFSGEIFSPPKLNSSEALDHRWAAFTEWSRILVSSAYTDAFTDSWWAHPRHAAVATRSLLSAARRNWTRPVFRNGSSAFNEASNRELTLHVGLLDSIDSIRRFVKLGSVEIPLYLREWGDGYFRGRFVRLNGDQLAKACRRFTVFGQIVDGPYLAVFAARSNGRVERLAMFPVAEMAGQIAFAESNFERGFLQREFVAGNCVFKPLRRSGWNDLHSEIRTDGRGRVLTLEHRPDCIRFENWGLRVFEVLGFPDQPEYMADIDAKRRWWSRYCDDGGCCWETVLGSSFKAEELVPWRPPIVDSFDCRDFGG